MLVGILGLDNQRWTTLLLTIKALFFPPTTYLMPIRYLLTRNGFAVCTSLLLLTLWLPLASQAQITRFVSTTGTNTNPATATSWATSTTNLQGAINASAANDVVWVARGVYRPGGNANTNRSISFALKNGVVIYGGFVGSETLLSQRPAVSPVAGPGGAAQPSSTTLSGEIGNPSSIADNSFHVINNPASLSLNSTARLDGVVITGGKANGSFPDNDRGGAIYNNSSSPSLTNCGFQSNTATSYGGAINNESSSSPSLTNCSFQSNTAFQGGAINNNSSSPTLTNCSFQSNTADLGGAILNATNSSPSLTNCSFQSNGSSASGGAIANILSSSPILTNCRFQNNGASSSGGAIFSQTNCNPSLTNCSFQSNTSRNGGAIRNDINSSPILTNCSFQSNTALIAGGAINNNSSSPSLSNCVLFGNGGGNTISNTNSSSLTASYSLFDQIVTGYTTGPGNLTTTTSPFVSASSVAPLAGSLAINTGNPASVTVASPPYSATALPQTDLVGNPRIIGCWVDMGAVEDQSATPPARLFVRASATGINTGLSWTDAFTDLQSALSYPCSQSLTEIWVAGGVYKPTSTTARTASFALKNGVAIFGGFVGNETQLSQRPLINPLAGQPSSTTLSGEIGNPNSTTDNSFHVMNNPSGLNSTARLDGVVITGGFANGSFPDNGGGAIYNLNSSPSLTNCSFQSNTATSNGGAILNSGSSSPSLTNCSFLNNTAGNNGGAINSGGSPSLTNCSFQSNTAATSGGAIYNFGGNPSLTNCSFRNNQANSNGGAVANDNGSTPSLTNCSFQSNTAIGLGGAIRNFSSNPSLTNCVLFGNGGGNTISNVNSSTVTASYSLFDQSVTGYTTGPGNLTTTTSPFVSLTSVALRPGSPAINVGNPASVTVASPPYSATALPQTDLASNPRIVGGRVDMGAVEFGGGADIFTLKNGNWSDPTIWSVGRLPLAGERVRVQHQVQVSGAFGVGQLVYEQNGKLVFTTSGRLQTQL